MATTMLYKCAGGSLEPVTTHNYVGTDAREAAAFLKKNSTTMGISIQYAVTANGLIIKVIKRGKVGIREIKRLQETASMAGDQIVEWLYSYAFATTHYRLDDGTEVHKVGEWDLTSPADWLEVWHDGYSLDL